MPASYRFALKTLYRGVDYLESSSSLFQTSSEKEAMHILRRLSREVFEEYVSFSGDHQRANHVSAM